MLIKRGLAWGVIAIGLYLGAALIGAFVPAKTAAFGASEDTAWIMLVRGPIHYDILLPVDDGTRSEFAFLNNAGVPLDHFNAAWLSVGWGSAAFYTTAGSYRDVTAGAVFRAATGDAGVMRFEVYGPIPSDPHIHPIKITTTQLDQLRTAITADFTLAAAPLVIDGFSDTDAFYPAKGRFHLGRTCNVWVGDMLSAAGLRFGAWTPTPYAVTLSLWWNGHLHAE